jgi:hypothetical protein
MGILINFWGRIINHYKRCQNFERKLWKQLTIIDLISWVYFLDSGKS